MAHQDPHWDSLKVTSTRDKEKTIFLLLKALDEAGLLTQPIRSLEARKCLVHEINRSITRMPKSIRQTFMKDGNACISSLTQLATYSKHSHTHKLKYYEKTASHMLRDEYFYIVDLDGKLKGPFLLSNLLQDHRGFYSDGTIEERLLNYNRFLEYLYQNRFDPDNHEIRLLYAETSSDGVFEGIETNKVYNCASWISAMIEEQNVLQDIPEPFEFHIVDPEARECAYECDWARHADSMNLNN
ncbi:uncharacterized protein N7498_005267 [Penicillium cinerascens]|uniref:Uncharacterized protein n=1 Tax=Penicillium cinerascens TaxID=70096 RepID=A0A9W9MN96_9EURO|nr:uncharacterized protein N7498_005267 [Penicillium cinerascens]KAJ5204388.1 hypothetical protein N7498_005267 [Penicillium cinerascens]